MRALVFDTCSTPTAAWLPTCAMLTGSVKPGQPVKMINTGNQYEVKEVGVFRPKMRAVEFLEAGDTGYVIANIKTTAEIKIGDTLTDPRLPATTPLPGFQEIQPMVFSGIYPINTADFEHLKTAMGKLQLNDAAFVFMAGKLRRARLRLPLRLPRPAAHGDHPGAAAARVRHGHHRHVSVASFTKCMKTNGEMIQVDNPEYPARPQRDRRKSASRS